MQKERKKPMILYRDYRSTLADSMKTLKEFDSEGELLNYLRHRILSDYGVIMFSRVLNVNVTIEPEEYAGDRIGWNRCHYVYVNGGVVGMCNMEEAVI